MSARKEKRIENKKRKAAAFLELIAGTDQVCLCLICVFLLPDIKKIIRLRVVRLLSISLSLATVSITVFSLVR